MCLIHDIILQVNNNCATGSCAVALARQFIQGGRLKWDGIGGGGGGGAFLTL